jgi:hypothetical protein
MKLTKGLFRDVSLEEQPNNTWVGGKNLVMSNKYTELISEPGFTNIASNLSGIFIGVIKTPIEFIVFSILDNEDTNSEIGIVRNGEYSVILRANLNFNINYPIFGEYYYNYLNELIIVFSDRYNTPKIINVDTLPFQVTPSKVILNTADIFKLEMFSQFQTPRFILSEVIESGGNLLSGIYYLTIQYELPDSAYGNFMQLSNPITIFDATSSLPFHSIVGCEANTTTGKAIKIAIDNIDTRYKRFRFGIVHRANSVINCYVSDPMYIETNSNKYVINTIDGLSTIQLSDILVKSSYYTKIGATKVLKDQLWIADLETSDELRYQKYANNIKLEYVYSDEVGLDAFRGSYKDPIMLFNKKSFMPGEVMAYYIRFRYKGGNKTTQAFHIPGRPPTANDYGEVDAEGLTIKTNAKRFHLDDTCTETKLSYWENENEVYPNDDEYNGAYDYENSAIGNGVDLRGLRVRHHRFPSVKYLHNNFGFVGLKGTDYQDTIINTSPILQTLNTYTKILNFNFSDCNIGTMTLGNTLYTNTMSHNLNTYVNFHATGTMLFYKIVNGATSYINGKALFTLRYNNTIIVEEEIPTDPQRPYIPTSFNAITSQSISLNPGDTIKVSLSFISLELGNDVYANVSVNNNAYFNIVVISSLNNNYITGAITSKVLGVKLTNIYLPQYIVDNCDSYELLYATRDMDNSIVLSQGMLTQPLSSVTSTPYTRLYEYDLISNNRSFKPTHITFEGYLPNKIFNSENYAFDSYIDSKKYAKINNSEYLDTDNKFGSSDNQYREKSIYLNHSNNVEKKVTTEVLQVGDGAQIGGVRNGILSTLYSLKDDVYYNYSNQKLTTTGYIIPILNTSGGFVNSGRIYGGDVVVGLIGTKRSLRYPNTSTPIDDDNYPNDFRYVYNLFPIYSVNNHMLRYPGKQLNEKYYPYFNYLSNTYGIGTKITGIHPGGVGTLWETLKDTYSYLALYQIPDYYSNIKDYTSLNNIEPNIVFNHNIKFSNKFPYRVHKSIKQQSDSKFQNWRKFLPEEYYESTSNKGKIVALATDGEDLLILHEHTLMVARGISELRLNNNVVAALGDSSIFTTSPIEILYNGIGAVGCQSKFAVVEFIHGILIVDRRQGKVYIYKNLAVEVISDYGMYSFLEHNLQYNEAVLGNYPYLFNDGDIVLFDDDNPVEYAAATLDQKKLIDNPYTQFGIHAVWDDKNSRILITKKSANVDTLNDNSFTISYYPEVKVWGFFHEYIPLMSLYNKNGVYLLHDNDIYKTNAEQSNFYFGSYKSLYIDLVFNTPVNYDKIYNTISWITKYSADAIENRDRTFDKISIFTHDQFSGEITLSTNVTNDINTLTKEEFFTKYKTNKSNFDSFNIRRVGNVWNYNHLRDIMTSKQLDLIANDTINMLAPLPVTLTQVWDKGNLFINPFIIVRLELNPNVVIGDGYPIVQFKILDISTTSNVIRR